MIFIKDWKFPGGSIKLYRNDNMLPNGELILYVGKKIKNKFFADCDKILEKWDIMINYIMDHITRNVNIALEKWFDY